MENNHPFRLLSSGMFKPYYFQVAPYGKKLRIGHFFRDPERKSAEEDTLTFVRIR